MFLDYLALLYFMNPVLESMVANVLLFSYNNYALALIVPHL